MEGAFEPLDDIYDKFEKQLCFTIGLIEEKIGNLEDERSTQAEKLAIVETLVTKDIEKITQFFEDMKARADQMKANVLEKYNRNLTTIQSKLQLHSTTLESQIADLSKIRADATELKEESSRIEEFSARQTHAALNRRSVSEFFEALKSHGADVKLGIELDSLMSREETFSDLGTLTVNYSAIESQLELFVRQNFPELCEQYQGEERNSAILAKLQANSRPRKQKPIVAPPVEEKIDTSNLTRAFAEVNVTTSSSEFILQTRFSSNEIYTFQITEQKFIPFQLYTDEECTTPFEIFNNCAATIIDDNYVFFLGGEDPAKKDRSSARVFYGNLKNSRLGPMGKGPQRIHIKEINSMAYARQDFTLCRAGRDSLLVISGYDSNLIREKRFIPKVERLDLAAKKFYELRDVNYPRVKGAATYIAEKEFVYLFAGFNENYINKYIDKIERYNFKLNDWATLKFNILDDVAYSPSMNAVALRAQGQEILVLGGSRDGEPVSDAWVFDYQKMILFRRETAKALRDDILTLPVQSEDRKNAFLFSGNTVNHVYRLNLGQTDSTFVLSEIKGELSPVSYTHLTLPTIYSV
eukprot:TRINITY_DN1620_c0_g1_i19.p1 TRINITY_DN1620_c0_g1~~TRINITY_DN1620_c0_g1_i19.p1  ORF type:complete len:582 (-),score=145.91 TRINITY_DN1620_c0_g1_i19:35-1780(-)